jgi:putative peptidoglycan lipid II flippase
MLPQGMFSVAVATVLFPALSRLVAREDWTGLRATQANGMRQIALLLIPAAAVTIVLPEPITRLVYERGAFDAESTDQVAEALFWFSFSLPFSGFNLLLTRTFFSLQRPWTPTALAGFTLAINFAVSAALYGPLGIGGVVLGTVASTAAMTVAQAFFLRRRIGGLQLGTTIKAAMRIVAASAVLGVIAYVTWYGLDRALGDSLLAQAVSVGVALTLGSVAYAAIVLALRIPEAQQIRALFTRRLRRS